MRLWQTFLEKLKKDLGESAFDKWIKPFKVLKFDALNLHLDTTNSFCIFWFQEHIKERPEDANGRKINLHFYLNGKPFDQRKKKAFKKESPKEYFSPDHLFSFATFENFVKEGTPFLAGNLLKGADSTYNPLFLYGSPGSGKTHLLMAAAKEIKKRGKEVFYVQAPTFVDHVVRAFKTHSLRQFRLAYRKVDCLILDDVHLLKKKFATQEELFHTFNHLHTRGKQLIFGSKSLPRRLEGIEERLNSRFEWGMTLPLEAATPNEIRQILEKRAELLALPLKEKESIHLYQRFQKVPSLIRALEALALRLHTSKLKLDIATINELLKDLIQEEMRECLTPERIVKVVAETFKIDPNEITGRKQDKACALPRKIGMYFCRKTLEMSYLKIGEFFSRDHSTVMSSIKQIEKGKQVKRGEIFFPLLEIEEILSQEKGDFSLKS